MFVRLALLVAVAMQGLIGPASECAMVACGGALAVARAPETSAALACCGGGSESDEQTAGAKSGCRCCGVSAPCRQQAPPSAPPATPRERSERDRDGLAPAPALAFVAAPLETLQAMGGASALRAPVSPPSVRARLSLLCVRTT